MEGNDRWKHVALWLGCLLLVALGVYLLMFHPEPPAQPTPPVAVTLSPDQVVYHTQTGEKYHRAGCRYLEGMQIELTVKEAEERGLAPCSVCLG